MKHSGGIFFPIVIMLASSLIFMPAMYAQEMAGNDSVAQIAAPASVPASPPISLASIRWKMPTYDSSVSSKNFSASIATHSFLAPASQSQATAPQKTWTKGGKIMTIIGLALVGTGAVMMTQEVPDSEMEPGRYYVRWKRVGGITMAGGAALTIIGLTRRQ
jgi:hypothetical protein